jgi:hypothetical protein
MKTMRNYYRCHDCLHVFALDEVTVQYQLRCKCGGSIQFMGTVKGDSLVRVEHRTPCDERCTSARGPVCNCRCCAANHGTKLVLKVTINAGKVPPLDLGHDSLLRGETYRGDYLAALDAWRVRHLDNFNRKMSGQWLSGPEFQLYLEGRRARNRLDKIRDMKVYSTRQKKLREFAKEMDNA